jgi:predicted ATP-grasp superfamily ATP-dependent carboligase
LGGAPPAAGRCAGGARGAPSVRGGQSDFEARAAGFGVRKVDVRALAPIDWDDALVLVAFPTIGSVASIAGHYLQQKLDLPLVGSFLADPPTPIAAVRNGVATSAIRIFGGEVECELPHGPCPRLYLVLADVPLSLAAVAGVSHALLTAAKNARLVLALDAVARDQDDASEGEENRDVYAVSADAARLKDLELKGVTPLPDAFIGGMTGQLLLDAFRTEARVGALIVDASRNLPDGRAAARLVEAVDQLLPTVPVDTEPLLAEVVKVEEELRKARAAAQRSGTEENVDYDSFI